MAMKRQSSLFDAWQSPSPKAAKVGETTHSSLKRRLAGESWAKFQEELEKQRGKELILLAQKAARRARRENRAAGELQDPSLKGRGVRVNTNTKMGRKPNNVCAKLGIKNHRRELGGPVLRRDRTAHEKLAVLLAAASKRKAEKREAWRARVTGAHSRPRTSEPW